MDKKDIKRIADSLIDIRSTILEKYPFFGRLLLHMPVSLSLHTETAYTDMNKIVFGVKFADMLSREEITFVFLHETMHCVLKHPIRGKGLFQAMYNVACDIVINSMLFESMGYDDSFKVAGETPMHLAPNGKEGRLYTAEQVYKMLIKKVYDDIKEFVKSNVDSHDEWENIKDGVILEEIWNSRIKKAARETDWTDIPGNMKRYVRDISNSSKIDWKQVLHDFIQNNKSDYTFTPPDKRFTDDYILPSFQANVFGSLIEQIWFCVDTSGSISDAALSEALGEIRDAILQIESVSGYISFFDAEITEPVAFESFDEVKKLDPIGGGGTDFCQIFDTVPEFFKENPPKAIIILTDGYADFPSEEETRDIPVFWIIVDSYVTPPFGECVHIES